MGGLTSLPLLAGLGSASAQAAEIPRIGFLSVPPRGSSPVFDAFKEGLSSRTITGAKSDVLPVPMFVKYPGQKGAAVDRRNAELIDVVPTIADVLGIDLPWRVDGASLLDADPPRRPKRAWSGRARTGSQ